VKTVEVLLDLSEDGARKLVPVLKTVSLESYVSPAECALIRHVAVAIEQELEAAASMERIQKARRAHHPTVRETRK